MLPQTFGINRQFAISDKKSTTWIVRFATMFIGSKPRFFDMKQLKTEKKNNANSSKNKC